MAQQVEAFRQLRPAGQIHNQSALHKILLGILGFLVPKLPGLLPESVWGGVY
jgi:hypothetical protein